MKYYSSVISAKRLSGVSDEIPIVLSENIKVDELKSGDFVSLNGEYRSYNLHYDYYKSRLKLFVHVNKIVKKSERFTDCNSVYLTGVVCKKPVYRKTPLGKEITDIILAVNREYGVSSYIPLILCGSIARKAKEYEVGKKISIAGRIQSREYLKKFENGETEARTAYEVSVSTMKEERED